MFRDSGFRASGSGAGCRRTECGLRPLQDWNSDIFGA